MRRPTARSSLALLLLIALGSCTSSGEPAAVDEPTGAIGSTTFEPGGGSGSQPEPENEPENEPLLADGDWVVIPSERYQPMWDKPGKGDDPDYVFDTKNPFGELPPMLVAGATRRDGIPWYEVYLPLRPNGTTGWVRSDQVKLRERHERIEVDLSKRTLEYLVDDELEERFKIGVGTSQYPTGKGEFYVWVKVPYEDPSNPYGIMALGLSGFSPVLSDWPGEGRMAVHGTPYASNRGQAVSHGCVRVYNEDMESLLDVPLGTPVIIQA